MVRALQLVRLTAATTSGEFVAAAKKVQGVRDAFVVFGRFDVAIFLKAKDLAGLAQGAGRVRKLKGLKNTETLPESL